MPPARPKGMWRATDRGITNESHTRVPLSVDACDGQWAQCDSCAPAKERSARPLTTVRRVVGRALIAAPRERVWEQLLREPASPWRFALDDGAAVPPPNRTATTAPLQGVEENDEIVVCLAPRQRGHWPLPSLLFRKYGGKILLRGVQRDTTAVIWTIEFAPSLPGTGRLTAAMLDWLLDAALVRFKRALELRRF